nr:MAG: hypothetical protein 1 [Leviviridae sp.]
MAIRNRVRSSVFTGYRTEKFGSHLTNSRSYTSLSESCDDETGPGDNSPTFTVERTTRDGGLINGIEKSNLSGYIWNDYPCAYVTDSYLTSHLGISGRPSNSTLAAQVAARTQPFRSSMVSLEYLSDLSDLGGKAQNEFLRRLRGLSKVTRLERWPRLRKAAKLNLIHQFGILPLISDIETLLEFQSLVDARAKELKRLYEGPRGLRRTLDLWSGSSNANIPSQTIQSYGVLLHARITKTTTEKVKGHIRWHTNYPVAVSDQALRAKAKKAILGYSLDPANLYELMPWSWLVDYFSNLGTIVKGAKNLFDFNHSAVRIMDNTRTTSFSSNHDTDGSGVNKITCTPMSCTRETKTRRIATPSIIAQDVILTESQLSILGSLAVLRS